MTDVLMPRLSDSMEEGTIIHWLKADGDAVRRDEDLVEIETDKATVTFEAQADGVLAIVAREGESLPVGALIARIGAPEVDASAADAPRTAAAAEAGGGQPDAAIGVLARAGTSNGPAASPVARRLAASLGIDLGRVAGSGPRGRILKADVQQAADVGQRGLAVSLDTSESSPGVAPAAASATAAVTSPPPGSGLTAKGQSHVQDLSRVQQTIARRMAESKATVPDFQISIDVDMGGALDLREQLKALADDRPVPTINDIVVKACATALRRHPRVNGAYRDGHFELYERVNVGVAVAAADALLVPIIADADGKSLGAIAAETRLLAERAREGELTPPELAGGTFTVSNLGMFGIDRFAGIVNPPQAAILCVGATTKRAAVASDGTITARPLMTLTLISDHRILYGADAARFLGELRQLLEAPLAALL